MGMSRGIERLDVKRKKQEQERAFQQWAEANSVDGKRYDEALGMIRDAIAASNEAYAAQQYLNEALQRSVEIMTPASYVIAAIGKKGKKLEDPEALKERLRGFYKDYNPATDRRVARRMFELVMEHVKELPDVFVAAEGQFDDLDAAVDYLYDNSVFADETRALEFVDRFSRERLDEDPAALLALSVTGKMLELQQAQKEANRRTSSLYRRVDEAVPRPRVGGGRQLHDSPYLRAGAALRSGRRRDLPLLYDAARRHGEGGPEESDGVLRARQAQRALCRAGFRRLCQRAGRTAGRFSGESRHYGRQLRFAGRQRRRRTGGHQFRPHVAFDDERPAIRPRDLPQYRRRHPLRALHDRPHRRSGAPVEGDGAALTRGGQCRKRAELSR